MLEPLTVTVSELRDMVVEVSMEYARPSSGIWRLASGKDIVEMFAEKFDVEVVGWCQDAGEWQRYC